MSDDPLNAACPDAAVLRALLDGTLPDDQQAATQAHVDQCPTCEAALRQMTAGGESWIGMAQKLKSGSGDDPKLTAALERLKADDGSGGESSEPAADPQRTLDFLQPADDPKLLGKLGQHEISEVVGWGGMGVVLKAYDPSLHRVVAVKVLASHLAHHAVARKRFIREAQAAAAVCHDNVVTIHAIDTGLGEPEGVSPRTSDVNAVRGLTPSGSPMNQTLPKIIMQFVAGGSLQERIDQEAPLELKEILRIAMQTAAGLAAAHAQGVVHRDVKPANILLENGVQRVKLTDFGLARVMDDASLTLSGVIAGTPQYMAPEQAWGRDVDARADLFSLGAVMYAMCSGHSPFRARTTMAVLKRVCEDAPRPLRAINPDIPEWLVAIIEKLLAKNPDDRFQSATEVSELLGRWLAHVQQPTVVPSPTEQIARRGSSAIGCINTFATANLAESGTSLSALWGVVPLLAVLLLNGIVIWQEWMTAHYFNLKGDVAAASIAIQLLLAAALFIVFRWGWNSISRVSFGIAVCFLTLIGFGCAVGVASYRIMPDDNSMVLRWGLGFQVVSAVTYLSGLFFARPFSLRPPPNQSLPPSSFRQLGVMHAFWPLMVITILMATGLTLIDARATNNLTSFLGFAAINMVAAFAIGSAFRAAWNSTSWLVWIATVLLLMVLGQGFVIGASYQGAAPLAQLTYGVQGVMTLAALFGLFFIRPLIVTGSGRWMSERLTGWQRLFAIACFTIVGTPLVLAMIYFLSYAPNVSQSKPNIPNFTPAIVVPSDKPRTPEPGPDGFPKPQFLSAEGTLMVPSSSSSDFKSRTTLPDALKPLLGRWVVVSSEGAALDSAAMTGMMSGFGGGPAGATPSVGSAGGGGMSGGFGGSDMGGMGASVASPPLQWIEFAADHVVVFDGRQAKLFAEFTADVEPKQITLRDQSNPLSVGAIVWRKGIFRLERDRLIICWTTGDRPPPTEFVTEDHYAAQLLILRREWNPPLDFDPSKTPPPRAVIPFTTDEAKRYQEAWARSANVPVETTNSLGMKLRVLPAGALDPAGADALSKFPMKSIVASFSQPIYMATTEVTVSQFQKFVETAQYETTAEQPPPGPKTPTWKHPGIVQDSDQHPVVHVSWQDANAFCRWLSDIEQQRYRLPTITEWAFAARAGVASHTPLKSPHNARLRFFDTTAPVGSDTANLFGLHDLFGNVSEWANDNLGDDQSRFFDAPAGAERRGFRVTSLGGSYQTSRKRNDGTEWMLPQFNGETGVLDDVGFRVVREIQPAATVSPP